MRCQKHDERSYGRMLIATAQPPFTSPSIRSAGTTTSSKNTSANSRTPLIISSGATVIPGVSMSTKNAVMPRWRDSGGPGARQQHAAVGVLRQAGPDLLAVDHPRRRGRGVAVGNGAAAQRREVAARARLGEALAPHLGARQQAGDDLGGERGRREVDQRRREHLDEREEPGVGEVAGRERGAELGPQHRRPAEPADALRPAVPHPARVEQDRLHALHLRDLLVERAGRGDSGGASSSWCASSHAWSSARKSAIGRPRARLVHVASPLGENHACSWRESDSRLA